MRLKKVKGALENVQKSKYYVENPESNIGKWKEVFGNNNPIHIEIGMGKGNFIVGMAQKNPNINFIGIEMYDSVLVRAVEYLNTSELELNNLKLLLLDANNIENIFEKEIEEIYLNFSDPWPKARHHLRRLSSKVFLEKYDKIFKGKKEIYQRTDNQGLYIYSLMSYSEYGYVLSDISFNLHGDKEDLITTEYEDKFSSKGMPIYSVNINRIL